MKTLATAIAASIIIASSAVAASSQTVLPEEASLRLIVDDELISSKKSKSKIGDSVSLTVADDIIVGQKVVIPQGSKVTGRVTHVLGRGPMGLSHPGELSIRLEHALVNGERI